MKELCIQKLPDGQIKPFSQEDMERFDEYRDYQTLRCKVYGVQKERSYQQLKLFWGCCRTVADNTEDPHWDTSDKVAFQIKVALHFVDPDIIVVTPAKQYTKELMILRKLYHLIKSITKMSNLLDKALLLVEKLGKRLRKRDEAGKVVFCYRSISYPELPHMEACNFFDRAFVVLAKKIGITVDELLENTKREE